MRKLIATLVTSLMFLTAARADNATAGASVTLDGTFFTGHAPDWGPGIDAAPNDLVSGGYQPNGQQWNFESVWWNGAANPLNNIVIALTGSFLITNLKIQADDNDWYKVEYRGADWMWHTAWDVSPPGGWGLRTSSLVVGSPFVANAFRLTGSPGDAYFAISQFEATGTKPRDGENLPEGGVTVALLGATLGLLGLVRRALRAE